jgi:hypothetical protein
MEGFLQNIRQKNQNMEPLPTLEVWNGRVSSLNSRPPLHVHTRALLWPCRTFVRERDCLQEIEKARLCKPKKNAALYELVHGNLEGALTFLGPGRPPLPPTSRAGPVGGCHAHNIGPHVRKPAMEEQNHRTLTYFIIRYRFNGESLSMGQSVCVLIEKFKIRCVS